MLRILAIPARQLAFEKNRQAGYFLQANHQPSYSIVRNHGHPRLALPFLFRRMFSHYNNQSRGSYYKHLAKKFKQHMNENGYCKRFYAVFSDASPILHHTQIAFRRLNPISSNLKLSFSPVIRTACALSLSFTRFDMIPGLLAFTFGEFTWIKRVQANAECTTETKGPLYMRVKDPNFSFSYMVHSMLEGLISALRAVYLAILFSPAILISPFADCFGIEFRRRWLQLVHYTLEKAGPAFIKWGQWAATRPDLFPNDLCTELAKLHTKAPSHSFLYSRNAVEKAFGRKLIDIFDSFEEEPIASGSIAQVHRAFLRYRYPGQRLKKSIEVAVKVRHPGVSDSIRRDFTIINMVAKISKFIPAVNWLRLDESVEQFAVFMMSQVDLTREAAHLSRFIYNFKRWKDVSFPRPVYPLVHPAVLVESFEQGENVSRYIDDLEGHTSLKRDLAHIGTHALLKMLLVDNFIHADMHPGNILVRVPHHKPRGKKLFRHKPHIVFLDVGMTAELSRSDQMSLLGFFKAVAVRDGRTAAECTLRLSKRQNCPNPEGFVNECERMFSYWGTPEGDVVHPAECMHKLLEQVRRYKVNIDGNVCTVMVTVLVLEGWQRKLDPNFNIMHTLKTLLFSQDWAQPMDNFFT